MIILCLTMFSLSIISTATTSRTATSLSTTITSQPVTTSAAQSQPSTSKDDHRGVLIGVIVAGVVALLAILGGMVSVYFRYRHGRPKRGQSSTSQTPPDHKPLLSSDPGNTRPSMEFQSNPSGSGYTQPTPQNMAWTTHTQDFQNASDAISPQRYSMISPTSEDSDMSPRRSQMPAPANLISLVERSNQHTQQSSSTFNRGSSHLRTTSESISGRGDASLYFAGAATALPASLSSSSAQAQYSTLPQAEEPQSTPIVAPRPRRFRALPDIWGERRRRESENDGYSDVLHSRSELASPPPLSTLSPPPPSYRAATPDAPRGRGGRR